MGNVTFTPFQELVFSKIAAIPVFQKLFYFGGGTALSVFYLHHRLSDDLDFFCEKEFDKQIVVDFINRLAVSENLSVKITVKETVMWFELKKDDALLKVDFLNFPYPRIEKGVEYQGMSVDSPRDIGANKLLLATLETNPKDYVDLYFLMKDKYTIWDIIYAVEKKYRLQIDLIALGKNFLEVEQIEFLPRMVKTLTLSMLKDFFRQKAKELGTRII